MENVTWIVSTREIVLRITGLGARPTKSPTRAAEIPIKPVDRSA